MPFYVIDKTIEVMEDGTISAIGEGTELVDWRGKALYKILSGCEIEVTPFSQVYDNAHNLYTIFDSIIFIHCGTQERFLEFAQLNINNNNYFICYTGGKKPGYVSDLENVNPDKVIFDGLSPGANQNIINKKWDIQRFVQAVNDKNPDLLKHLIRTAKPYLSALSIMCTGFLVQHKHPEFEISSSISSPSDGFDSIQIWQNVLGQTIDEAKQNIECIRFSSEIEILLKSIYPTLDNNGSHIAGLSTDSVYSAYKAIAACSY